MVSGFLDFCFDFVFDFCSFFIFFGSFYDGKAAMMRDPRIMLSVCVFFLFNFGNMLFAAESWPVFHGPKGDNKSADTNLLQEWPEEGPKLLWTFEDLGFGYSGVTIDNGRIFTTGNEEGENDEMFAMVYCLDMNGQLLWKESNGPGWVGESSNSYPGSRSTPTIDGDYVYDETPLGQLTCFDVKTGNRIWSRNILQDFDGENIKWALAESVVIDGDNLICAPGGSKASVVALNKKTGDVIWETPSTGNLTNYATPYIFEFEGGKIIAVMNQRGILGVDAKDGTPLFSFPHETRFDINATMPIFKDGFLFITSGYGTGARLLKLTKDGAQILPEEVWANRKFDNHHGGLVLLGDYVYGTTMNGRWASINFMNGEMGYEERGIGKGSVHFADGLLYGFSENGRKVALIRPVPEEYAQISEFVLPNEAPGQSWAHPVVCGGKLYLRHAKYLYCYDVNK